MAVLLHGGSDGLLLDMRHHLRVWLGLGLHTPALAGAMISYNGSRSGSWLRDRTKASAMGRGAHHISHFFNECVNLSCSRPLSPPVQHPCVVLPLHHSFPRHHPPRGPLHLEAGSGLGLRLSGTVILGPALTL